MNDDASPKTPRKRAGNGNTIPKTEDRFATGYDFLLINHDIDEPLYSEVYQCLTRQRKNEKIVVIVVTFGGRANVAYRIARMLQSLYKEVVAFVPSLCKSAGTLIVVGAHCVCCIGFGEIGPLDVQVSRRDEIWGQRSGLTTRSALLDLKSQTFDLFSHNMLSIISASRGSVSFRLAAEIAAKMTADIMSGIYAQINPEALGQDFMDLNVAKEYCERLNKRTGNLKPGAITRLVYEYPTHDFVIDFEEATELFHNIALPTETLVELMKARMADMLRPKAGDQGVVEMLTIPTKPAKKAEEASEEAETKGDDYSDGDKTLRGNGGAAKTSA
jgi:Serine dehydrogenase proteinase